MKRLLNAFRTPVVSAYLCHGHATADHMAAALDACQGIEIGIPFSDPAADGPIIQQATHHALASGATVDGALACAKDLAGKPGYVVAMTYANIAYRRGWGTFAKQLAAASVDGLILPDVPMEEAGPVRRALAAAGVAWIPLVAPTTSTQRMREIAATSTGFLYVVSSVGTTGGVAGPRLEDTVARARSVTDKPIMVGFGIRSRADVKRALAAGADGAIIGSHLVQMIEDGATPAMLAAEVAALAKT